MACAMAVNSNSLPIALISSLSSNIAVLKMSPDDTPDSMLARGISYLVLFSTLGLIWRWSFMVCAGFRSKSARTQLTNVRMQAVPRQSECRGLRREGTYKA